MNNVPDVKVTDFERANCPLARAVREVHRAAEDRVSLHHPLFRSVHLRYRDGSDRMHPEWSVIFDVLVPDRDYAPTAAPPTSRSYSRVGYLKRSGFESGRPMFMTNAPTSELQFVRSFSGAELARSLEGSPAEVVALECVRRALLQCVEHEVDEMLLLDQKRDRDPHRGETPLEVAVSRAARGF